jgi:hypothetical protein
MPAGLAGMADISLDYHQVIFHKPALRLSQSIEMMPKVSASRRAGIVELDRRQCRRHGDLWH